MDGSHILFFFFRHRLAFPGYRKHMRASWRHFHFFFFFYIQISLLATGSIADTCVTRGSFFLFRYVLISFLGTGRWERPGVALLVYVLPSGFVDGSAGHTALLRRSLSWLAAQGA